MSVRVNLLPRETSERQRASRQRGLAGLAGLLLLVILAGAYWLQSTWVSDARAERDAAQEELDRLAAREAQLAEFEDLQERVEEADATIAATLAHELSMAGILQDIALVTPTDTAFSDLDLTAIEATGPDDGAVREVVARIVLNGETLHGHAPGVERLLLEFDKIASFFDVYFSSSVVDAEDDDVSQFTVEVDVGQEARTGRYDQGVPEELR